MSESTRRRRWGQFGLRFVFVAVLLVAAYCAGFMQRASQVKQRATQQAQLKRRNDDLQERNLELQRELLFKMVEQTTHFTEEVTAVVSPDEKPDGRVVRVNPSAGIVWIDLGSNDGLRRQQTFSIYDKDEADFQNTTPKATIEIASVEGPEVAQARIVSKDDENPIVPQDVVFSPTWQPGQRLHFALAGKLDYNDDGVADNRLIKDLILNNGGVIDAEVDEQGRRTGKVEIRTRYLVLGDPPGEQPDAAVNDAYTELITQAEEIGAEKVYIKHLLEMNSGPSNQSRFSGTHAPRFRPRTPASGYP
jgi:hypothetical protein